MITIPVPVQKLLDVLSDKHSVYLYGGCVRDYLLQVSPQDWDVLVDCSLDEASAILRQSFYKVLKVGTAHNIIFLQLGNYSVQISSMESLPLDKALATKDFTINAMAIKPGSEQVIDFFGGRDDLALNMLRCIKTPAECFTADPLRMLRAVRLSGQYSLIIRAEILAALCQHAPKIVTVSMERIRDEFTKILLLPSLLNQLLLLGNTELLRFIVPELYDGINMEQCGSHIYDVYEHNVRACAAVSPKLHLRLAALLHDVGKPLSMTEDKTGRHFHGHQVDSAKIAQRVLTKLLYPKQLTATVVTLVRYHMFIYNDDSKPRVAKKLLNDLGLDMIYDLIELRRSDRVASGRIGIGKSASRLLSNVNQILLNKQPYSQTHLVVNGKDIMEALDLPSGELVGQIKKHLLEIVVEHPELNNRECLLQEAQTFLALQAKSDIL